MTIFPISRRVLIGISAATLVLVVLVTGKPAYRAAKAWRAGRLIERAEQQGAKGQWTDAYQSLHAANSLAPEDTRITRATARLLGERADPQAIAFLEMLIQSPDGTPQDRVDLIRLALRGGQLTAVQKHLVALLEAPQSAHRFDTLLLASEWHGRCGDRRRAAGFAREALAHARDARESGDAKLLLARLLLLPAAAPDAGQQAEAKQHLWEIAARDDRAGIEALLLLNEACKPAPSPDEARRLGNRLGSHPLAGDELRLLGLTWKLRAEPARREKSLDDLIASVRDGDPARLATISRWLVQQQESRRVMRLIPLAAAMGNRDLFLIYVDALADLGRWQDLQLLLAGKASLPIDPTIRNLYEVRTALALGREAESRDHWADVMKAMRSADPKTLLYVAQYAERLGMRDDAAKAYRLLTGIAGAERAGYLGLILLTEQAGDTRKLRDQMKEFASRFPNEFEPQNDLAYLDLLLNENTGPALKRAEQLVNRYPDMLAYRTTLALAHLRNGDAAAARKVYDGIETDWRSAKPGSHAVYAAVLAACGEQALAGTQVRDINLARLKPEERELIAGTGGLSAR